VYLAALTENIEEGIGKDVTVRITGITLDNQHITLSYSLEFQTGSSGAKHSSRVLAGICHMATITSHTQHKLLYILSQTVPQ